MASRRSAGVRDGLKVRVMSERRKSAMRRRSRRRRLSVAAMGVLRTSWRCARGEDDGGSRQDGGQKV